MRNSALSRFLPVALLAGALLGAMTFPCRGQATPSGQTPRTWDEIQKDFVTNQKAINELMPGPEVLLDEARRKELQPKLLPLMRRMFDLSAELAEAVPEFKPAASNFQVVMRAMLALLDEKQASGELARLTVSKDPVEASTASSWSIAVRWIKAR